MQYWGCGPCLYEIGGVVHVCIGLGCSLLLWDVV